MHRTTSFWNRTPATLWESIWRVGMLLWAPVSALLITALDVVSGHGVGGLASPAVWLPILGERLVGMVLVGGPVFGLLAWLFMFRPKR